MQPYFVLNRLLYPGPVPDNYKELVTVEAVKNELRYLFPSNLSKPAFDPIAVSSVCVCALFSFSRVASLGLCHPRSAFLHFVLLF